MLIDEEIKWAKSLLKIIENKKQALLKNEKSTSLYWRGDYCGSIYDIRDAEEWVKTELARCVLKHARRLTGKEKIKK